MGDANGGVVAAEEGGEGLVDKGFGFGVKGRCCFSVD